MNAVTTTLHVTAARMTTERMRAIERPTLVTQPTASVRPMPRARDAVVTIPAARLREIVFGPRLADVVQAATSVSTI